MKFFVSAAFLLLSLTTWTQKPSAPKGGDDIILKLNGDEMIGTVTEINDAEIKFVYKGESIQYSVKKLDILKITFASGRIEMFNKPPLPSESQQSGNSPAVQAQPAAKTGSGLEDHHNKIAILPFKFLADKQLANEEIGYKVQEEAFAYLSQHNNGLELQDPNTTNALLLKAGVNASTARSFTTIDICSILGVEFILGGTVTQNNQGSVSTSNTYANSKDEYGTGKNNNQNKSTFSGSSTSRTTQNYKSSVTLNLYNDKGTSLFSQSHEAFFNTEEAYRNALQYLLKRTPVYRK